MSSARESLLILRVTSAGRSNFGLMAKSARALGDDFRRVRGEGETLSSRLLHTMPHVANAMSAVGQQSLLMGGAALAGMGLAANEAAKFSTQTTLAATQAGNSLAQVRKKTDELMPAIIKQMQKFPATSEEMTKAVYNIFSSLDLKIPQGVALLKTFNKAAVGGQASLESVAEGGITIMNTFGKSAEQMPAVFDKMFATVRFGRTTFDQLSQAMNTLVPAFQQGNQSVETMLGSFAFLTRKMPNTARASTALARAVEILGRQKFIDNMAKAGVKIADQNNNLLDLETVLTRIRDKFPGLEKGNVQNFLKEMSGTEGTIQARRALTFLFRDLDKGGASFHDMQNRIRKDNNEFGKAFKALNQTAGVQWQKFLNQLKAGAIVFGQQLIPEFVKFGEFVTKGVKWFNDLSASTKQLVAHVAALGTAFLLISGGGLVAASALTRVAFSVLALLGAIRKFNQSAGAFFGGKPGTKISGFGQTFVQGGAPNIMRRSYNRWARLQQAFSDKRIALNARIAAREAEAIAATNARAQLKVLGPQLARDVAAQTAGVRGGVGPDIGGAARRNLAEQEFARAQFTNLTREAGGRGFGVAEKSMMRLGAATRSVGTAAKVAGTAVLGMATSFTGLGPWGLAIAGVAAGIGYLYYQSTQATPALAALTDQQRELANAARDAAKSMNDEIGALTKLPKNMADVARKRIELADAQKATAAAIKASKEADTAKEQAAAHNKLVVALDNEEGARKSLNAALGKQRKSIQAPKEALQSLSRQRAVTSQLISQRAKAQAALDKLMQGPVRGGAAGAAQAVGIQKLQDQIKTLTTRIGEANTKADKFGTTLRNKITNTIKGLAARDIIKDIPKGMTNLVGNFATQVAEATGGKISVKDLNKIITITAKYKDLDKAQAAIDKLIQKATGAKPTINVHTNPDVAAFRTLGLSMSQGIAAGLAAGMPEVQSAAARVVNAAAVYAHNATKPGSPSRLTASLVGKPMAQGITKGMLDELGGIKAAQKTIVDAMISEFVSLKDQMVGAFGDLFTGKQGLAEKAQQGIDFGFKSITSGDVTKDLKDQLNRFSQWRGNLNKLFRRRVPGIEKMRKELTALGPEALPELQALNSMTNKQLNNYVKLWKQKQKLINKATHEEFRNQQKMWVAQGRAVAFGILSGLRSGNLDKWMRRQAESMFGSFQKKNKSKSPSKLYEEEGHNMVDGLERGMRYKQPSFHKAKTHRMKEAAQGHVTNITQHITANKDENLLTTLDKAGFRYRTANR